MNGVMIPDPLPLMVATITGTKRGEPSGLAVRPSFSPAKEIFNNGCGRGIFRPWNPRIRVQSLPGYLYVDKIVILAHCTYFFKFSYTCHQELKIPSWVFPQALKGNIFLQDSAKGEVLLK